MMAEGDLVDVGDLPEELTAAGGSEGSVDDAMLPLAEVERRHILRVLARTGGNRTHAARILGIHRATLHRLLDESPVSL